MNIPRLAFWLCFPFFVLAALAGCGGGSDAQEPATAPVITAHPVSEAVLEGASVVLSVSATGSDLRYQWRRNATDITGATGATHQVTASALTAGAYTVVVSNALGSAMSDVANLTVSVGQPVISAQPPTRTIELGQSATFKVGVMGNGLRYQWLRDGVEIPGATSDTHVVDKPTVADSGHQYTVRVQNDLGTATSDPATLWVSLIQNGGFEALGEDGNATRWVFSDLNMTGAYQYLLSPPPYGGSFGLANGYWAAPKNDWAYQSVAIPPGVGKADLSFILAVVNIDFEYDPATPVNTWRLVVRDESGAELEELDSRTDADTLNYWQPTGPFDLSAYQGRTVRIAFESTQASAGKNTLFMLDNVLLVVQ
jgi:hypothetical protein